MIVFLLCLAFFAKFMCCKAELCIGALTAKADFFYWGLGCKGWFLVLGPGLQRLVFCIGAWTGKAVFLYWGLYCKDWFLYWGLNCND